MNGLTFKYVPKDVFGKMVRELTLGLYGTNTTLSDGTILGSISTDIYGNELYATEYQNYYQFKDVPARIYKLIKSGPGVLTEILEDKFDVPYSGATTGSDMPYKDNSNVSLATKLEQVEALSGVIAIMNFVGEEDKFYIAPNSLTVTTLKEAGTGTITFETSTDGITFTSATLPISLVEDEILKVSCTGFSTFKTITLL